MKLSERMLQIKDTSNLAGATGIANITWDKFIDAVIQLEADKARLDFLQAQTKGYGKGWLLRASTSGRGMRLHETSQEGAKPTVRETIDDAIGL